MSKLSDLKAEIERLQKENMECQQHYADLLARFYEVQEIIHGKAEQATQLIARGTVDAKTQIALKALLMVTEEFESLLQKAFSTNEDLKQFATLQYPLPPTSGKLQ